RLVETVLLRKRVRLGEDRLGLRAVVGGDAAREEARVDAEAQREPVDRLGRRARLAALDLRDVLLAEPVAREIRLREAGRHPKLAQALAEPRNAGCGNRAGGARSCGARSHRVRAACRILDGSAIPPFVQSLKRGMVAGNPGQARVPKIT